jgi:YtkA-like protein
MYRRFITVFLALILAGCGAAGQTQTQGDLTVTLATNPAVPIADRPTTFSVTVKHGGVPLDGAYVTLERQMPGMEHMGEAGRLIAQSQGAGRYQALSAFSMGSRWDVAVAVTVADQQPQVVTFPLDVEQP